MDTHQRNGVFSLRKEGGEMDSKRGALTCDLGHEIGNAVDGGFDTSPFRI